MDIDKDDGQVAIESTQLLDLLQQKGVKMTLREKLWQHLHDEHGLLLLGSELEEIIMLAKEIIESDLITESNAPADLPAVAGKVRRDVGQTGQRG